MVLLFSNERVIRDGDRYYARIINFTDFLVLLSLKSDTYRLALSCDRSAAADFDTTAGPDLAVAVGGQPFVDHPATQGW